MTRFCSILPILLLVAGCSRSVSNSEEAEIRSPRTKEIHSVSFAEQKGLKVGMTKKDVLSRLKDAVPRDKVDEHQRAGGCIIRPSDNELASDSWIVTWVSHLAVGATDAAKLHFAEGQLVCVEVILMAR
jgi:hypothetical protein